jgi:non-heme chloroperoxidase
MEVNGLKVYAAVPTGPVREHPVLFIHGMWGGAWFWRDFLRRFAERGYHGYALDLRGRHGSRPVPDIGKVSLADAQEVALALANPILVGHSLGGLLAMKLAESSRPPAVVAITPAPPRGVLPSLSREFLRAALTRLPLALLRRPIPPVDGGILPAEVNLVPPEERERLQKLMVPESGRMLLDLVLGGLAVGRLPCPLLMLGAAQDRVIPTAMVRRIARKYAADYREYAEFGHNIIVEFGWERVAGDIMDWLEANG